MRSWITCAVLCASLCFTISTIADDANELGIDSGKLTPLGAIRAGNQAGTIPEWTGGITKPPAGYTKGSFHPDPFASDNIQYTVSASNVAEYEHLLSPGQIAMIKRYPTWKLNVYPTRRSASYPQNIYEAAISNAKTAKLVDDGNGIGDATMTSPFPIPENGLQCIWNHLMRWRGESLTRWIGQAAPTAGGSYTIVRLKEKILWAYGAKGATVKSVNNRLFYFFQEVTAPARLAGNVLLVHETLNQLAEPRKAWVYNPGQRRVRRAPNVAYDNPGTASDAQRTNDQLDMFNGSPDRYNWTLVGRREMLVPYNAYKLHSNKLKYKDILQPGHINPDHVRYELHRVWEVQAKVKSTTNHHYATRTFYFDEDSWQLLIVDQYDKRGKLWRISEAYCINFYEMPLFWDTLQCHYDLQNGRYLAFGLNNEYKIQKFDNDFKRSAFTPSALRRKGKR